MNLINYILDNDMIFYSVYAGTAGMIGFSFIKQYLHCFYANKEVQTSSNYANKEVQTSALDDYSDIPGQIVQNSETSALDFYSEISSQIVQNSETSAETNSPEFYPVEHIDSITQSLDISTSTTFSPISTDMKFLPDIVEYNENNQIDYFHELKYQEIQELFEQKIHDHMLTDSYVRNIVYSFDDSQLGLSNINDLIYQAMLWWC